MQKAGGRTFDLLTIRIGGLRAFKPSLAMEFKPLVALGLLLLGFLFEAFDFLVAYFFSCL
jgi:hypothetical protein